MSGAASSSASAPAAAGLSRTLTLTDPEPTAQQHDDVGILRLRPEPRRSSTSSRRVVWTQETVDNEGLGRKKSKICCIYHKPKAFDESSDESSSDGEEGTDTESDDSDASAGPNLSKAVRDKLQRRAAHQHADHEHGGECSHGASEAGRKSKQKSRSSGRTQTVTLAETEEDGEGGVGGGEDSGGEDASGGGFRPNAYERGTR
ncbi:conserved hypothetical protein [Sporisorium reilianum SRZ2]|uniref:Type 1 phosphatases regulator n=1 Tax=Sporisorium reilianum (strain SRZ2) TaxID=999809 RepID=E6ZWW3_SPORE|nr:conserved hypothetical protein [Sporisorium reilianum SRZ2]